MENANNKTQVKQIIDQINIAITKSISNLLQKVTKKEFTITSSHSKSFTTADLNQLLADNFILISSKISGDIECENDFVMSPTTTAFLSDLMMMGDGNVSYDSKVHLDAIQELFNQVLGGVITEVKSEKGISISNGELSAQEVSLNSDIWTKQSRSIYTINIKNPSNNAVKSLLHLVSTNMQEAKKEEEETHLPETEKPSPKKQAEKDLGILLDISLPIIIELGRTEMLMGDILELGPSSVIELDKLSGEYVDIYVNNKKFAKGEVVVVDENFGVRIMELLGASEGLKQVK
ncbi:MAG: flagellar motor switch protein FliN [Candidatus Cloacimonetes bacterium]|nr:flagellar motor switch protein FliN [Candidatus Cloacimonadota bacterium]